jgi:hypothetical protein
VLKPTIAVREKDHDLIKVMGVEGVTQFGEAVADVHRDLASSNRLPA